MELNNRASEQFKVDGSTLSGYAVVYNTSSNLIHERGKIFNETIARGAFDASLNGDIKLYFNHDKKMPLARTSNKSLRIFNDEKGIRFEADLPNTTLGNDVKELLNRGTLTGEMSFGFFEQEEKWTNNRSKTVTRGALKELSIVVDAAYQSTHSQLRSQNQEINNKRVQLSRRKTK